MARTPIAAGMKLRRPLESSRAVLLPCHRFGLDHSMTQGIVSGLGREMQSITRTLIRDVVQTDASINPGVCIGHDFACDLLCKCMDAATISAMTASLLFLKKVRGLLLFKCITAVNECAVLQC
jgi:hypothetical protein